MRLTRVRFSAALLLPAICLAQSLPPQGPVIGTIQIYGNHKVPETEIRKVLGVREGGTLPRSKGELEERLTEVDNIVSATLFAACCDDRKTILYVGVEEKGAAHFDFNSEPTSEQVSLPPAVGQAYANFLNAAAEAARAGEVGEELSEGHSLMANAKVRYIQLGFTGLADEHRDTVRRVLREALDPEQRAIAAYVLGYSSNKASIQDDLQYALRDPDDTVRANALRAIAALAVYSQKHPEAGLKVSPTWLIEMLNSLVWTDRNNAAIALVTLTESREPSTLEQIRTRALPALVEMARWKHLPHALPAFILTGRIAGVPETELQDAWNREQREAVIKRALASGKRSALQDHQ